MIKRLLSLAATLLVCMAVASPAAKPAVAVVQQPLGTACKQIVVGICTSCSVTWSDDECKTGTVFKSCDRPIHTCDNGAQCDQAVGTGGPCNP